METISVDIPAELAESIKQQLDVFLEKQKPEQWQPKRYEHGVLASLSEGVTQFVAGVKLKSEFTRQTKEQAEDLSKLLRRTARLHDWACEREYIKEWEADENNWFLYKNSVNQWLVFNSDISSPTEVNMTKEGAEATAEALNSGRLVL